jgi:plastocyanin
MGSKPLPGLPPLVDYDVARVYRGVDPRVLHYAPIVPQPPETTGNLAIDRVETVVFKERGRYLVICGVLPHFNEGMHGYVRVTS